MERAVEDMPLDMRIRAARRAQGLTQEQLAAQVGSSRHSVVRWESGASEPEPKHREGLAEVLGGSPADYERAQTERVIPGGPRQREALLVDLDALYTRLQGLEARVADLEQFYLRDLAERVIAARDDPGRRDELERAAVALAETVTREKASAEAAAMRDEELAARIDRLDPRMRLVLSRRFGLEGQAPQTLEAIGKELGITRERVRQLEAKGLRELNLSRARKEEGGHAE
jgi:transcriptional regulator with XRE-family HTH domain